MHLLSWLALAVALAKELSGEAHLERATPPAARVCDCAAPGTADAPATPADRPGEHRREAQEKSRQQRYVAATEERFKGIRRCC